MPVQDLEPYYGRFDSTAIDDILSRANTGLDSNGVANKAIKDKNGNDIAATYAPISSLATVATSGSYTDLSNKPALATVATTGSYNDLSDTPDLAAVATSGSYADLSNKPTLATVATSGSFSDLIDKPVIDNTMSSSSTNAVQNKTVNSALALKAKSSDLSAESQARAEADSKFQNALVVLIDSGPKNRMPVNSGTTPSGAGYFVQDLPIVLPAGDWVLTMKRTGNTTTSIALKAADNTELYRVTRGAGVNNIVQEFTISAAAKYISIYVGNSIQVSEVMLTTDAEYKISDAYVPYRPSWDQMYEMIQNLQPGT